MNQTRRAGSSDASSSLAYRSYVYFHESEVCSYAGTEPADDVRYQTHVSKKTVVLEECTGHGV